MRVWVLQQVSTPGIPPPESFCARFVTRCLEEPSLRVATGRGSSQFLIRRVVLLESALLPEGFEPRFMLWSVSEHNPAAAAARLQ